MDTEEKVSKQIEEYKKLAEEHKGIDVASLMINALEQAQRDEIDRRKKRRAYLVSVILPPFGLFFAAYYALGDKPDGKRVAINCVILTVVTIAVAWGIGWLILSSAGPEKTSSIENINVKELERLLQE
jgi:hypothetical protein